MTALTTYRVALDTLDESEAVFSTPELPPTLGNVSRTVVTLTIGRQAWMDLDRPAVLYITPDPTEPTR